MSSLRNRYRVIRPLGGGGFGRTFLAEDEDKLNELCVVKQLVPQFQSVTALAKATQLFQQEARRLQQLGEHPQIPTLYAYFEQDDYLYLVQQLIVGQTLKQELEQQGAFSEQKIWQVLTDLLPVLKFVHEHQVIHRDIKPDNIIRRQSDGKLVLIDFGVAKQLSATSVAKPGTSIGSFGYASIEQIQGGKAYPASDLYSLGMTCFHLLTQIHPSDLWAGQGYAWVANWQLHLNSPVSQELSQVLDKLLQQDIQQRYQSVDEVLHDLQKLQPPQVPQPLSLTRAPILPELAVTQPPQTVINHEPPVFPNSQQRSLSLASANSLKGRLLVGGFLLLLGLAGYEYWQIGRIPTLTGHSGEVNTVAFSAVSDSLPSGVGQKIASGSDDKTIKVWNLNSRQIIRTLRGHSNWVYSLAISSDGNTLISGSKDNTIKVWNLNTGQELRTLTGHSSYINSVVFSPDGKKIASGSYDKTIKVWNLTNGQVSTLSGHKSEVLAIAISPDGQKIASGSTDRTIKVWNLNTGKELRTLRGHLGDVNSIAISPDGQELASVSDDKTIKFWNLNTGREIRTLTGHSADVNSVAFSPDGQKIATGSDDKTIKVWNLVTGEELATLRGHSAPVWSVAFSPDGQTLASGSADKTIKIWRVPN